MATRPTAPARCSTHSSRPDAEVNSKTQPPTAPDGRFAKDEFTIDLDGRRQSAARPAHTVALTAAGDGRVAKFARGVRRLPAG